MFKHHQSDLITILIVFRACFLVKEHTTLIYQNVEPATKSTHMKALKKEGHLKRGPLIIGTIGLSLRMYTVKNATIIVQLNFNATSVLVSR